MKKLFNSISRIVVVLAAAVLPVQAQAGFIFNDKTAFDTVVANVGLSMSWMEDFESFPIGAVPNPLPIGGGQAEISSGLPGAISTLGPTGQSWVKFGLNQNLSIRGAAATSLGVQALSFDFTNQANLILRFVLEAGGFDQSPAFAPLPSPNNPSFVGWIGAPGEVLDSTLFSPNSAAIVLDNVRAFRGVPAPATLALFGLGLAGLGLSRRQLTRS